jgi:hypothetical protein
MLGNLLGAAEVAGDESADVVGVFRELGIDNIRLNGCERWIGLVPRWDESSRRLRPLLFGLLLLGLLALSLGPHLGHAAKKFFDFVGHVYPFVAVVAPAPAMA